MRKKVTVSLTEEEYASFKDFAQTGKTTVSHLLHRLLALELEQAQVPKLIKKDYLTGKTHVIGNDDIVCINLRLRGDEINALDRYCDHMDLRRHEALIALVRNLIVNEPVFNIEEIDALRYSNIELHRCGVNLNQIARKLNKVDKDPHVKLDVLVKDLAKQVTLLRDEFNKQTKLVWAAINSSRNRHHLHAK